RRRRHGRRNRVAERARRGLRGRLGAAARARPPSAERPAPALLEAGPRRLPPHRARGASRPAAGVPRAVVPARPALGRAARPRRPRKGDGMSYTLRGRIESRLATALPALVAAAVLAAALGRWWPLELVPLMLGVGLALDVFVYDRLLDYQPGWLALPLGLLELALLMGIVRLAGIDAPFWPAVALFGGAWLFAQVLGHAGYPLLRLSYGAEGGELGRAG